MNSREIRDLEADKKRGELRDIEETLASPTEEGPEWDKRRAQLEGQAEIIRNWLKSL